MKVMLVKGGPSLEFEVSLRSAATIAKVLKKLGHEVVEATVPQSGEIPKEILTSDCDLYYPCMHGHLGEDGLIQGLFECLGKPYVSEDVATSAVGMDKSMQLSLFRDAGIPTVPTVAMRKGEAIPTLPFNSDSLMVKMNSGGSSIGVFPTDRAHLGETLEKVFALDEWALVQPMVSPLRELETLAVHDCRSGETRILGPIEVMAAKPYYIYENKYSTAVECIKPSEVIIDEDIREKILNLAAEAFRAVHGTLYMRIDFFLSGCEVMINEINTIPGSTETSHIIHLAGDMGGMEAMVSLLIDSALARYESRKALNRING